MRAWPVGQPPRVRHSSSNSGPAARWIAPSTPPPPSREALAALTIASTAIVVISPTTTLIRERASTGMALLPGVSRLSQRGEETLHERGQVIGGPAGDEVAVADAGRVFPEAPGVLDVVADGEEARDPPS